MSKSKTVLSYFSKRKCETASMLYKACESIGDFSLVYVEGFIEKKCAELGKTTFVDAAEYDLSDGTEVKNVTVGLKGKKNKSKYTRKDGTVKVYESRSTSSFSLSIPGVGSRAGVLKSGDLRVVVYNPHKDELDFFFIPKSDWGVPESDAPVKTTQRAKDGTRSINVNFNLDKDSYNSLEPYRLPSFSAMATKKATDLTKKNLQEILANA